MDFYYIMVIVLFALAISDLIVGVSNDAVNFLNSAIGSKVASFKVIMIIAAAGILIGSTFSSGMMEIARKGIFNPQHFVFNEIMIIFLAVMLSDVLLLDFFNTFGMPTSTTVSIVFELLGAAVAIAIIKISNMPEGSAETIGTFINSVTALKIIGGILLSVIVAFSTGAISQYISRLIFSFNYQKRIKYIGALWGGFAISAITYFMIVKGAKGASFMSNDIKMWIDSNTHIVLIGSFVIWTIIFQICQMLFKFNVLKFTVLVGTFALAMAFAGNDLVNFIGVPLAGFESYKLFSAVDGADANNFLMTGLAGEVRTETYMLLIAGLIMVATLWKSKKAKNVVKTSLNLSSQEESDERFGSSYLARAIVRICISTSNSLKVIVPKSVSKVVSKQFDSTQLHERNKALGEEAPAFDMLRASVNLVIASILIAIGTSQGLPLSTTYVTFMVAMGTSLSDGAWGRESAVYRVTGVISVIGGWFFTAFCAFTLAFIIASVIHWGGVFAIVGLIIIAIYVMYHTHKYSNSKDSNIHTSDFNDLEIEEVNNEIAGAKVLESCKNRILYLLSKSQHLYQEAINAFEQEKRKDLKEINKQVKSINKKVKKDKDEVYITVKKLQENDVESGLYYVQVIDYMREIAHALTNIVQPLYNHLDNNHSVFSKDQFKDLQLLQERLKKLEVAAITLISNDTYAEQGAVKAIVTKEISNIKAMRKAQLKRIKKEKAGTKNSMLYLNILHETQNMIMHMNRLISSQRDLINYKKENEA